MDFDPQLAKQKIKNYTEAYKKTYPEEYRATISLVKQLRSQNWNKTAAMEGVDILHRPILELPETLFTIWTLRLTVEEMNWFREKESARWFAKTYPEFARGTV